MGKFTDFISDVAVTSGCAVGVGLISGKETQTFAGSTLNTMAFAVVYCAISVIIREFCRKNACKTPADMSAACLKKPTAFNYALSVCSFVCIVTMLAGVEQCLGEIFYISKLPIYAVTVAAVAAAVMAKGMRALKIANVASIALTAVLFVFIALQDSSGNHITTVPAPYMPVAYALFTVTMSLCVLCPLGSAGSRRQNIYGSVAAALIIAVLLAVTTALGDFSAPLPTLGGITSYALLAFAVFVIALSAMCGMAACARPIVDELYAVIPDKTLCAICVFGLAAAFSVFGFDFAVKFGYIAVACVGLIAAVMCAIKLVLKKAR